MVTKAPNPGALIDKLAKARLAKAANAAIAKKLDAEYKAIEVQIVETLEAQGITGAKGKLGTVSITESVVPDVEDWDKLYALIKKKGWFHLLNRAPNAASFREVFEREGEGFLLKHGVKAFNKKTLSLTAAK